ncbi:uncharacterized protein Z519_02616 [Cladophialophora bantiana CBS 173.52]|uniref:Uncharacterized protein n=1 Tax=Cladophialophora bantiana (strain ATCC 10958 / CBS 173.52 / CDC B-1940 / NIH 8579) TaxID=1442370 RepID=A0A0D2IK79_CLAB1|nr:uncharacterized protein Z519_02616 [Cladophialophora bantiana CBS 173.52]KIW97224.1 hypothetical protein Z519_02616 [Cladophialophora bantiana CBS 173.52]
MVPSIVSTLNRSDRPPIGPFSELTIVPIPPVNPTAYLLQTAGQVGAPPSSSPQGTPFPETFREQAVNAFANVANVLALKGATPQDIIKVTIFVCDFDVSKRDIVSEVMLDFLGGGVAGEKSEPVHRPASSLVGVAALATPGFLIEVEATAVVAI